MKSQNLLLEFPLAFRKSLLFYSFVLLFYSFVFLHLAFLNLTVCGLVIKCFYYSYIFFFVLHSKVGFSLH